MKSTMFERVALRLYRMLLLAYPRWFRRGYADDMADTFIDQLRRAPSRAPFLARAVADAITNGFVERLLPRRAGDVPHTPRSRVFYWSDIKYAFRLLGKNPVFTALTIVVLAGGLGLSIFTFSFLHTAMLKPLPLNEGDRVVRVMTTPGPAASIDAADLAAIRPNVRTLTDVGAYTSGELVAGSGERTRSINTVSTEWNIFAASRVAPALGRGFRPDDQLEGAEPVVVLGHRVWRVVFGGDTSLIGQLLPLSGTQTRLIGVMPEGYGFPVASDAWIPIRQAVLTQATPGRDFVMVYGRLAPGVGESRAVAELSGLIQQVRRARPTAVTPEPGTYVPTGMTVQSYPMAQIGEEGPLVLAVLNTLALLILLLACINVTNLLLARANERARETAVRLALGAPRGRLIMQNMWESIILCLAGGLLATGLAAWGLGAINDWTAANLEGNMAFWWVWGFDRTVLLSAGAFVTFAISVLGGVVSMRAAKTEINSVLQDSSVRGGSRAEGRVARALVITQVAVVSVLMFFGAMSAVVAYRAAHVDFGYDTRNVLASWATLPADRYPSQESRGLFFQRLHDQLGTHASIDGVLLREPLADNGPDGEFELSGAAAAPRPRAYVQALLGTLTPLGVALREGRFFDTRDVEGAERTAIVSAALAAKHWPGGSPVGRQIRLTGTGDTTQWRTVVGVVGDVLLGNPMSRDRSALAVYVPLRQADLASSRILFRHRGTAVAGMAAFHETMTAIDPLNPRDAVQSFDELLAKTTMMARSVTILFGACFGFALLLAVSGTYGLMARSIGRRTREIGVRRALGATDRNILVMLVGQGGRQLGIGALVALPLTLLTGFGFSRYFPVGIVVPVAAAVLVSAVITSVVLLATWLPTRKAIMIEPRDALWRE